MRPRGLTILVLLLLLAPGARSMAGPSPPEPLEDLQYRVGFGPWQEMARVHLILKQTGQGRYLAEFSGATQGVWQLLRQWLPERYQTEMVLQQGRLQPLVYREEFWNRGVHVAKEYRFDYSQQRLELWRQADDQPKVKKWQIPLQGPVYDPLSLFYNARLGVFGAMPGGGTLRFQGIPTPEPVEWVFRIGPQTAQGRKVMLTLKTKNQESDPYFILFAPEIVPNLAWTRVLLGKLTGTLLNPGGVLRQDELVPRSPLAEHREPAR